MRTEVSTTIFAAIPVVTEITDDVRRIPLADPVVLEIPQGGERLFPRTAASGLLAQKCPQASRITSLRDRSSAPATRSTFLTSKGLFRERHGRDFVWRWRHFPGYRWSLQWEPRA